MHALFERSSNEGRVTTDIANAARSYLRRHSDPPGRHRLHDTGLRHEEIGALESVETDDALAYGIVDEIASRAFISGAQVLAVHRPDIPSPGEIAAILRYPF